MPLPTAASRAELRSHIDAWKSQGLRIGFVPTMGALHEGHLSLVDIAANHADKIVVSIFVNPAQFAPHEDFGSYPRQEGRDLEMLEQAGAHLVYLPTEAVIYPNGRETNVKAGSAAKGLESDFRPHFFDGVVNVVHRLFAHVTPDVAIFGEKDYQQLCVIREMTRAQNMPIDIIGAPLIRDENGLALSSRNAYLSDGEYKIACALNKILFEMAASLRAQRSNPESSLLAMTEEAKSRILASGFDKIDYLELRAEDTLAAVSTLSGPARLLFAGWLGKTRLLDNVSVES